MERNGQIERVRIRTQTWVGSLVVLRNTWVKTLNNPHNCDGSCRIGQDLGINHDVTTHLLRLIGMAGSLSRFSLPPVFGCEDLSLSC